MIVVVKYNAGNVGSMLNALSRLQVEPVVSDDPELIQKADKVILPGVGEAKSAMRSLRAKGLDKTLQALNQPFLGVCLGLQLMCQHSEEGDTGGLGIFSASVKRFPALGKVPHMGWNNFSSLNGQLFEGLNPKEDMYYVHSYYATTGSQTIASCDYLVPFSAALRKDNYYAVQFHPEKSAKAGQQILKNFLKL